MAEDPALSVRVSDITDPALLFESYSTDQIRRVERRVRGEIEQKKEELRQMVGERYRDLIDAADTISDMRHCSESLVRSLQDMQRHGPAPGPGHGLRTATSGKDQVQWQWRFYTMAAQIRLLLEIPERIWSAVEACQYLQATRLHLLACRLYSMLQLEASSGLYSPILARFPILVRQVATTGHFRSTILLESRSLLRARAMSDQAIAEALVSTMLLEDSSPRQALADFLLARKASIHQLLNQPPQGAGIKAQVCSLVELLVTTLFQAYAVFCLPPEGSSKPAEGGLGCGMLFSILENVTSGAPAAANGRTVFQEESSTGGWFKYLPSVVTEFQPALRTLAQPIQSEQLRDTLQQWITTCKEDVCRGVGGLLVYVKTLKALAAIRDTVWDLLSAESIRQHWTTVCHCLLEHPLDVWEDFLQKLFLQRLQTITKEESEAISRTSVQLLSSAVRDLETPPVQPVQGPTGSGRSLQYELDVASFLWSESPGDLLSDAGWVNVSQRGQEQRSGLSMKTQTLTPCVQNFCSSLDSKWKSRLDDLQHYLPARDTGLVSPRGSSQTSTASSQRLTDCQAVEEALRDSCLSSVHHVLSFIHSEVSTPSPHPSLTPSPHPSLTRLASVLFMARLCQSMSDLCPNLKHCIMGKHSGGDTVAKATPRQGQKLGKTRTSTEARPQQAKWEELKEELFRCSMAAYSIWSSALSKVLLEAFGVALHSRRASAILTTATNWEDLEIQEEAESGSRVTSKIRLPVQPSWFVQSLLFQLCVEVNRVGGHAVPRVILHELLQSCLGQALGHYTNLSQWADSKEDVFPVTQNRALQMLFDLRYLVSTLGPQLEEGRSSRSHQDPRIQQICDWLESLIDPFDLDVFTPLLKANLSRLSQRTSVLLGLLTGSERQFTVRSSSVNSQEPFNILPLASSQIRFGLLPLSTMNTRRSKAATRGSDAPQQRGPSVAPNDQDTRPGSLFRQLANQDEDMAPPSLFKLSWLSGMK